MIHSPAIDASGERGAASHTQTMVRSVVAAYRSHEDAENAIRLLAKDGVNIDAISIIGRNFEIREDVKGFYHSKDVMRESAGVGALWGGLFGLLAGAGMFILPMAGPVLILGPLAGAVASIVGGVSLGVIAGCLAFMDVDPKDAIKYEEHIEAGEFLVVVYGASAAEMKRARHLLAETNQILLHSHSSIEVSAQ